MTDTKQSTEEKLQVYGEFKSSIKNYYYVNVLFFMARCFRY